MTDDLSAVFSLVSMAVLFGSALGYAAVKFATDDDPIADQVDALLPQTQCGQCGHPGCRPYAEAVANDEDEINKCIPGGEDTIHAMADLLGKDFIPLDAEESDVVDVPMVAYIREDECIGCTKCIQACPMDAILGAAKQMHTVIVDECTGCDLCVEPCPVDCIDIIPEKVTHTTWAWPQPDGVGITPGQLIPVRNIA
ncbi:electron transport complex subunit RsxB [Gammaproteobacteria bacterium 45_16_T64]|nr:electron transport complex subunit RsxB [Gammaproteobacteria bacterium 45_16_T64]